MCKEYFPNDKFLSFQDNQKVHICCHCLSSIPEDKIEEHVRFCSKHEPMKVTMPEKGEVCRFESYQKQYDHLLLFTPTLRRYIKI